MVCHPTADLGFRQDPSCPPHDQRVPRPFASEQTISADRARRSPPPGFPAGGTLFSHAELQKAAGRRLGASVALSWI